MTLIISRRADATIDKAKESYILGLIDLRRLELVTKRALTDPDYNAIVDLPLDHELDAARKATR